MVLREFCVVLFGHICVRFRHVMVFLPQVCKTNVGKVAFLLGKSVVGLYLGYLETTQNSINIVEFRLAEFRLLLGCFSCKNTQK